MSPVNIMWKMTNYKSKAYEWNWNLSAYFMCSQFFVCFAWNSFEFAEITANEILIYIII